MNEFDRGDEAVEITLDADPQRWPLLIRSAQNAGQAYSTKVEWIVDRPLEDARSMLRTTDFNYTQIFRQPFDPSKMTIRHALETMLDSVEHCLRDGHRQLLVSGRQPITTVGGVMELLGRWPRKDDHLSLRVLRPVELLFNRQAKDLPVTHEWIAEISLIATAGR